MWAHVCACLVCCRSGVSLSLWLSSGLITQHSQELTCQQPALITHPFTSLRTVQVARTHKTWLLKQEKESAANWPTTQTHTAPAKQHSPPLTSLLIIHHYMHILWPLHDPTYPLPLSSSKWVSLSSACQLALCCWCHAFIYCLLTDWYAGTSLYSNCAFTWLLLCLILLHALRFEAHTGLHITNVFFS